jgi:regulator of RNase E activity RraA
MTGTSGYPASDLCDALRQVRGRGAALSAVPLGDWLSSVDAPVFGPAQTLRISRALEPVDSAVDDWMRAFDEAPEGSVLVVEVVGDVGGAVVGDAAAARLVARGCSGLVVDGPVRDWGGISSCGLPAWVRGVRVDGTSPTENLNESGLEIRCGGATVKPGDIVAGDKDGVIVIPQAEWDAVRVAADQILVAEKRMFELLGQGAPISEAYRATSRA